MKFSTVAAILGAVIVTLMMWHGLFTCAQVAPAGSTIKVNKNRLIEIRREINSDIIFLADDLVRMADKSKDPIYIFINSPGGEVHTGLQFMTAMRLAQSRGVRIKCVLGMISASMAYHIYAACDDRYAFKHSLILWHEAAVRVLTVNTSAAKYLADRLGAMDSYLTQELNKAMGMKQEMFDYHLKQGTLWTAQELEMYIPDFMYLVEDVQGIDPLFGGGF